MYRKYSLYEKMLRWLIWKLDRHAENISDRAWAKIESRKDAS